MESIKNKIIIKMQEIISLLLSKKCFKCSSDIAGPSKKKYTVICRWKYCRAILYLFENTPFKGNIDYNIKCLIVYYMFLRGLSVSDYNIFSEWDRHAVYRIVKKLENFDIPNKYYCNFNPIGGEVLIVMVMNLNLAEENIIEAIELKVFGSFWLLK
ncbi:hypothetical protein DMUE_1249 [Dictyocoela muelleri]|nr:hypothetical protein DMUE_1249 [Dictyocoela muelleri]